MPETKTSAPEELRWRAAEDKREKNDPKWFAIVVAVGIVLLAFALVEKNFFFAVFVAIATVTLIAESRQKPRVFDFAITEKGVGIGKSQFYPYDELSWFDINEREERLDELVLRRHAAFGPYVKIPIDRENAKQAETILGGHIERGEYEPSLLDVLLERIGL